MSDQQPLGLPGAEAGGAGGRRGSSRRSSNEDLQQQQGQQLAQLLLAQMVQQHPQQGVAPVGGNVSPHQVAVAAAPVFTPADAAAAMAAAQNMDVATMMQMQVMTSEQAHAQAMEVAKRQVDLKKHELQQQVQMHQQEIERKKQAIEEQALVVQQQQARAAQIEVQHHYYPPPSGVGVGGSVLDASGRPIPPPSVAAVGFGVPETGLVAPQGAIPVTAPTMAEGNAAMTMPTVPPSSATTVPIIPPMPAIPPVQKHQQQSQTTIAGVHPSLMQHLQPLPEAAAPDISHIHQHPQPSALPSQIVLDRLESQKKHLKKVLRKKEEEIAQRQTQIAVKATKYTNAPMSGLNATTETFANKMIPNKERDSSNEARELEQQKDQKESTKNWEAATKKGRKKMNRIRAKGRKKSDTETSSASSKDISLEVVDEASAAVNVSPGNAVPPGVQGASSKKAVGTATATADEDKIPSAQELPEQIETPKEQSAKEVKTSGVHEATREKTPSKTAPNTRPPKPGSKLKLRKRNRAQAEAEAKAGPSSVEATVDDSPPKRVDNQGKVKDAKESLIAMPSRSRRTNKRKTTEEAKEERSKAEKTNEKKKDETKKESEAIIPTENDYLCGGSKVAMNHPGNKSLFSKSKAQAYHDGDAQARRKIVADLIDQVHSRDPPGRFLTDRDRKGEQWHIVSGLDLRSRIKQKFRDMVRTRGGKRSESKGDHAGSSIGLGKEALTQDKKQNEPEPKRKRKGAASQRKHERKSDCNDIVEIVEEVLEASSEKVVSKPDTAVDNKKEKYDMSNSYSFLRYHINSCQRVAPEEKTTSQSHKKRKRGQEEPSVDVSSLTFYPKAPLGQIWLDIVDEVGDGGIANPWKVELESPPPLDAGGTILGRSWIWDEGKYADENDTSALSWWSDEHNQQSATSTTERDCQSLKELVEAMVGDQSFLTNYTSLAETMADNRHSSSATSAYVPPHLRAYCLCGVDHGVRRFEEGSSSKTATATPMNVLQRATPATSARKRRSERQGSSVSLSNVLGELARGELNPHTLISCEAYKGGPELRFLHDDDFSGEVSPTSLLPSLPTPPGASEPTKNNSRSLSDLIKGSHLQIDQVQPFSIKVCPDAMLLADLQSHLSESEIIGFLGGRYVESERCIYVQAAFPCKSTKRNDQGFTDVEMDPVSQIIAGETIAKHGLEVVGWYHSHPSFQPDPSVTDIHNQGNYQHLFGDHGHAVQVQETNKKQAIPFVGLIVGTYDAKNPTAESVMRWFHVTPKETGNVTSSGNAANNNKRALDRGSSFVGAPSLTTDRGWLKERVYFPMALQVNHRHFRRFGDGDDTHASQEITTIGPTLRRQTDAKQFLCALSQRQAKSLSPVSGGATSNSPMFCQPIPNQESGVPSTMNEIALVEKEVSTQKQIEPARTKLIEKLENAKSESMSNIPEGKSDTEGSSYLLGSILTDAENESALDHAHPLLFNDQELAILRLIEEGDLAGDSIHAGVIWHAVEREQLALVEDVAEMHATELSQSPFSSSSILDLLLKIPSTNATDNASHTSIDEFPQDLIQDDAVLVHAIDVILSHYSTDSQRIDPFGNWNGSSGDKGHFDTKLLRGLLNVSEANDGDNHLERYYLETVLGFSPGHGVDSSGGKMRRGHKICICLLKWARRMQLLSYQWSEAGAVIDTKPTWDHESSLSTRKPHIFFVAEVMRLLAARWREADAAGLTGRRKRRIRHRPSSGTPSIDRKSPTEVESIVKSDSVKAIEIASNAKLSKDVAEEGEREEDKKNYAREVETTEDEYMST